MAIQKAVDNLKQGPKEDKVAVASGVAVFIVLILLVAWAIFFFRGIQRGSQQVNFSAGAQDEFNFSTVKAAQEQLSQEYKNEDDLRQVRNSTGANTQQMELQQQETYDENAGQGPSQFGSPQQ